ncbi:MAG: hypothetical protein GC134_03735 [Proteobacteria bacterium]|nr:hypothetical protein [Pseudomonadota bacterium]
MVDLLISPKGFTLPNVQNASPLGMVTAAVTCEVALHGHEESALNKAMGILAGKAKKLGADAIVEAEVHVQRLNGSHVCLYLLTGMAVNIGEEFP